MRELCLRGDELSKRLEISIQRNIRREKKSCNQMIDLTEMRHSYDTVSRTDRTESQ